MAQSLLIGAHMSIAGGVHKALISGHEIGASTIQIFTANQKQWKGKPISEKEVALWKEQLEITGIREVMSHDSYLINLGSNKPELLAKSCTAFEDEIKRCLQLDLAYLNFHPGAATGDSEENCLNRIVDSLLSMEPLVSKGSLRLLIEATAGQGSTMGYSFEHLGYLVERVQNRIPIGVCIDTCHIFAAGYDIRTEDAWNQTLKEFDKHVGIKNLCALHVNDSKNPLGSRKDRHASLGKGEIGMESFKVMMTHPKLKNIPKYLETPDGDLYWKEEIAKLRAFASK